MAASEIKAGYEAAAGLHFFGSLKSSGERERFPLGEITKDRLAKDRRRCSGCGLRGSTCHGAIAGEIAASAVVLLARPDICRAARGVWENELGQSEQRQSKISRQSIYVAVEPYGKHFAPRIQLHEDIPGEVLLYAHGLVCLMATGKHPDGGIPQRVEGEDACISFLQHRNQQVTSQAGSQGRSDSRRLPRLHAGELMTLEQRAQVEVTGAGVIEMEDETLARNEAVSQPRFFPQ